MPEIQRVVAKSLTPFGHDVACASSGREAVRLLADRHFDLVIADVLMPEGDGLELITEMKKTVPDTRILAISGGGASLLPDYCVQIAKAFGAHATLQKPFNRDQLLAGIDHALGRAA